MELFSGKVRSYRHPHPQCGADAPAAALQPDSRKIRAGSRELHSVCGPHLAGKGPAGPGGGLSESPHGQKTGAGRPLCGDRVLHHGAGEDRGQPQHHHDGLCGRRRAAGAVQQLCPVRAAQPHRGPFAFAAGGAVAGGEVPRERHPGEHHCDRRLRHRVPHRGHRQSGPGTGAGHRPAADPGAEQSAAGLCAGQF